MAVGDTNAIVNKYLVTPATPLFTLVGTRIYCPRLPENAVLPAIGFFTRGGTSTPYIPGYVSPSIQFDCWAIGPIVARQVYRALYDRLQGIQDVAVVIGGITYAILAAAEEVQGQDLADQDIPNYYRVLTSFAFVIRAE